MQTITKVTIYPQSKITGGKRNIYLYIVLFYLIGPITLIRTTIKCDQHSFLLIIGSPKESLRVYRARGGSRRGARQLCVRERCERFERNERYERSELSEVAGARTARRCAHLMSCAALLERRNIFAPLLGAGSSC